jgi:hypothetical protein
MVRTERTGVCDRHCKRYNVVMNKLKRILLAMSIAIFALPAHAADPLSGLVGQKRVLLLFSKSRSDATLDRQLALLGDRRADVSDRKMVVLAVSGGREPMAVMGYATLPQGAGRELVKRFEPGNQGLTAVLVGLDGTEKGRWHNAIDPQVLFDLIDSMPMRQEEAQKPTVVN